MCVLIFSQNALADTMINDSDRYTLAHGDDEQKALRIFNHLVFTNSMNNEDASWVREHAKYRSVRNLASKFLGKMTPGMRELLLWLLTLAISAVIIVIFVAWLFHKQDEGAGKTLHPSSIENQSNRKYAHDDFLARLAASRKMGLRKGYSFVEENKDYAFDERLLAIRKAAIESGANYFGTMQFSETFNGIGRHTIYYVGTVGSDMHTYAEFQLYTKYSMLMIFNTTDLIITKKGVVEGYAGTWCPGGMVGAYGYFKAKQNGDALNIQFFMEDKDGIYYMGRAMLRATR